MKRNIFPLLLSLTLVSTMLGSGSNAFAATNLVLWANASGSGALMANDTNDWWQAWGNAMNASFDISQDAGNDPTSGAMRFSIDFNTNGAGNDCSIGFDFGGAWNNTIPMGYLSNYVGIEFDILYDTNSTMDGDGNWGTIDIRSEGVNWPGGGEDNVNVTALGSVTGWQHMSRTYPDTYSVPAVGLFFLYLYNGGTVGAQSIHGHSTFWVDNVRLIARTTPPPPPPIMSIEKVTSPLGLQIFASYPGNGGQQQHIRTLQNIYQWIGQSDPVSYSLTITNYPSPAHSNFQSDIFLVPNDIGNESAPYYNEPNVAWVQIANNADGTATATFRYKTNSPNSIGNFYGSGTLGSVTDPSPLGTWSVTFIGNTNITLTSPSGNTANFTFPGESLGWFGTGQLYVSIGMTPGGANNLDQSATYSRFQIQAGGSTWFDDTFPGPTLDVFANWVITADSSGGIVPLPADPAYWVTWTLPDTSFHLTTATGLSGASWSDVMTDILFLDKLKRRALVQWSSLTDTNMSFFRLANP